MVNTWVCVASGPSLTLAQVRHIGLARAAGRCKVIAVNDCVYPCWFADVAYASDIQWMNAHKGLPGFAGEKVSILHTEFKSNHDDIKLMDWTGIHIPMDPILGHGGNSGHAAVRYAATEKGAEKIYLVGYDFSGDSRGSVIDHWFGKHQGSLYREGGDEQGRITKFMELYAELFTRGVQIINCTPGSKLDWTPRTSIEDLSAGLIS